MISSEYYQPTRPAKREKREKRIVEFLFYTRIYPIVKGGNRDYSAKPKRSKARGFKTLKLFRSWFNLADNDGLLIRGILRFVDTDEIWFWDEDRGWTQKRK